MFILMFTLFPVVLAVLLLRGCYEFSLASMPRTDNIFR
jgi:outer membrane murein-binding lipoprotein Lpp